MREENNTKNKAIRSHFIPTVCGVGVTGGEQTKENGKHIKSYDVWKHMLRRCYDKKEHIRNPRYIDCTVCDEWLFYPNFKKWYDENYYEIDNQRMALDKDILIKGNKIYSPETCLFVPQFINTLFIKKDANRGSLPIGVHYNKPMKKYIAQYSFKNVIKNNKSKNKHLGYYNTPEEAFQVYKNFKENYIKQVADHYKNKIPEKLYNAMYKYEVHIDD